jgi:hypothetical protein
MLPSILTPDSSLFNPIYQNRILSTRRDALIAAWALSDPAGRTCTEISGKTVALDLIENGGFETAGTGGADIWAQWAESAGTGTIADEGSFVHLGSHAAKLTAGSSKNTVVRPSNNSSGNAGTINVIPGMSCTLSFWTRGDLTNAGRYSIFDNTNSVFIQATVTTGIVGSVYTQVTNTFVVPATCYSVQITLWCPSVAGGISYFDDASLTCNYPLSGVYQPSGITYGEPGIGDGRTSTKHNGSDSGILIGSKAFGQLWNGNVGSSVSWGRVAGASQWTDGSTLRYPIHVKSRQSSNVYLVSGKQTTNHTLTWIRRCVNAQFEYTYTFPTVGTLKWFCQGFTWDINGKFKCYLYIPGELNWTKLYDAIPSSGNENWSNASYTADDPNTVLAAGSLTQQEWIGWCSWQAYWGGATLTEKEMRDVMVV